uniref:Uncharacterized protein n=1 Tax=Romanomermis culicivorax TaxID=13658 RepID=A0A915I4P0_ROMCU
MIIAASISLSNRSIGRANKSSFDRSALRKNVRNRPTISLAILLTSASSALVGLKTQNLLGALRLMILTTSTNASEFHSNSIFVLSQQTLRLSLTAKMANKILTSFAKWRKGLYGKPMFAGFRERLEAIRVDTIFLKRKRNPDDIESYFLEKLEEWSDLNGTLHFDDFKKSIPRGNLQTYAQVLHLQKPITDALIHHLNVEDSLCMPALLERFLPLVAHKRDYMRRFAAESVSYLIRKHDDFASFLDFCCDKVDSGKATDECIAELVFQAMQSVKKTLHTTAREFYETILEKCATTANPGCSGCQVSLELTKKLTFGIKSEDLVQLLPCLITKMANSKENVERLPNLYENLLVWTQNKRSSLLHANYNQIFDEILKPTIENFEFKESSKKLLTLLLNVIEFFIVESGGKVPKQNLQAVFQLLLRILPDDETFDDVLFEFLEKLIDCSNFDFLWPSLQGYFENRSCQNEHILEFYCQLCGECNLDEPDSVERITSESILELTSNSYCKNSKNLCRFVTEFLNNYEDFTTSRDKFLTCLFLVPQFPRIDQHLLKKLLDNVLKEYNRDERDPEFLNFSLILLLRCAKISNFAIVGLEFGTLFEILRYDIKNWGRDGKCHKNSQKLSTILLANMVTPQDLPII